jgi:hypothetical protein
MKLESIRQVYDGAPFRPFRIHTADGRTIEVPHREFMWIMPNEPTIMVARPEGGFTMIDSNLVTQVEVEKRN